MGDPNVRLQCLHCELPLVNIRPWPEKGSCGECPRCGSTFMQLFATATQREKRYRDGRAACALAGTLSVNPRRWERGLGVIAAAYKREELFADAKRLEDEAIAELTLTRYVRARARAREREACGAEVRS